MNKDIRRDDWGSMNPSLHGFGINDVNYRVRKYEELPKVDGKRKQKVIWMCPYYTKWANMLKRCYNKASLEKKPTYQGCAVCEEWRYLSNFIKWVDSQPEKNWQNCQLDKDLLFRGNKLYSPETVVFISGELNSFLGDCGRNRGGYMVGVSCIVKKGHINPYLSQCENPLEDVCGYIGYYPTELEAHKAWQERKHQYACQLADLQSDPRVAKALRERYAPDKDWTKA